MSFQKVKNFLIQKGIEECKIHEFENSSATVELAAHALNCDPCRIAKTLSFKADSDCILVVAAGDTKIDNAKFKIAFNVKAKMLTPEEVLEFVGYPVGGVCPFDVNPGAKVYLDISLKRFKTVFPACASSNSAVELTIEQIYNCSDAVNWVDVCKGWEGI